MKYIKYINEYYSVKLYSTIKEDEYRDFIGNNKHLEFTDNESKILLDKYPLSKGNGIKKRLFTKKVSNTMINIANTCSQLVPQLPP